MHENGVKTIKNQQEFRFSCSRCSVCCRHEAGYVFLSHADINRMAAFLKQTETDFIEKWCRTVAMGQTKRLSLRETAACDCIFWSNRQQGCGIYEARPLQCRSYPFWPHLLEPKAWLAEQKNCPGINRGRLWQREEIERWQALREKEPYINADNR